MKRSDFNEVIRQGRADSGNKISLVILWWISTIGLLGHFCCLPMLRLELRVA
jgi:hypothetical protein